MQPFQPIQIQITLSASKKNWWASGESMFRVADFANLQSARLEAGDALSAWKKLFLDIVCYLRKWKARWTYSMSLIFPTAQSRSMRWPYLFLQREQQVREVLQADNSVRVLLAESDVRDKKINELAAKLHSAEQQQKAAMQTVQLVFKWMPVIRAWQLFAGAHDASTFRIGVSAKWGKKIILAILR
jgi:hypothetical protein